MGHFMAATVSIYRDISDMVSYHVVGTVVDISIKHGTSQCLIYLYYNMGSSERVTMSRC